MKETLWNLNKNQLYEDLARTLIAAKNEYSDGSIGWAREANLSISSPMNTSEALLGLLYSSNIIAQGNLSRKIRACVKGGVKYLINNQCRTGGWTTSESNNSTNAQGNMMTTATAIWSIVEYVILHDDSDNIESCLEKSLDFINSCRMTDSVYKFRPSADKYSNMSTLYALMGLVNLNIYYSERENKTMSYELSKKIDSIIENLTVDKCSTFEKMFLMLVLKKIDRFFGSTRNSLRYKELLIWLEKASQTLTEEDYLSTYCDIRYIRESGEKTEFFYFTPIWILSSISYGIATPVPYRRYLVNAIVNRYFSIKDNSVHVIVGDREWTWATAQLLMAFSMYGTTQSVGDFLNLEEEKDHRSAFIVYGRNIAFKESIETCLKAIGLKPQSFDNNGGNTQSTFDAVIQGMRKSAISIVLLTGDDEGKCRTKYWLNNDKTRVYEKKITPQPRMNVVFEAGYSYALRNNRNTIIITTNDVRPFTDLDGINKLVIDVDKRGNIIPESLLPFKDKLVDILNNCGCELLDEAKDILKTIPVIA